MNFLIKNNILMIKPSLNITNVINNTNYKITRIINRMFGLPITDGNYIPSYVILINELIDINRHILSTLNTLNIEYNNLQELYYSDVQDLESRLE